MLTYNSQLKKLALPEYGRNIQQMVDYCCTIEDREERNKCAYSIINTMSNLFPQLKQETDYQHKLWDHLAIMSDFKLDIDYPYEIVKPENLDTKPVPIKYKHEGIKMRHYGKIVDQMIGRACEYPDGDEKEALVMLIANHMKKLIYQISNEDVEDAKIFKDLEYFSKGQIKLDPATHSLHQFKVAPSQQATSSKKKKKK
ncbi:MAG: DUF4290 domain-containing protein [Muribaculaceae bacterium]|nr:DUF4290 domain-containing protein [Muribaculaceae bacterium]